MGDAVPRQVVLEYIKKVTEILVKWEHGDLGGGLKEGGESQGGEQEKKKKRKVESKIIIDKKKVTI